MRIIELKTVVRVTVPWVRIPPSSPPKGQRHRVVAEAALRPPSVPLHKRPRGRALSARAFPSALASNAMRVQRTSTRCKFRPLAVGEPDAGKHAWRSL